jgi:hypothetical protein
LQLSRNDPVGYPWRGGLAIVKTTISLPDIPQWRSARMADYTKYDPRVVSLVLETRSLWDPAVGPLNDADQHWLAAEMHRHPERATKIAYERTPTGFSREITVTVEDIARLYEERLA